MEVAGILESIFLEREPIDEIMMANSIVFGQKHWNSFIQSEMYQEYLELHVEQVWIV